MTAHKNDDDNGGPKPRTKAKAEVEETNQTQQPDPNAAFLSDAKRLAAQGFGKAQIAQQLSAKHAITVADATALLDKEDPK
jgi:hypothetical protein